MSLRFVGNQLFRTPAGSPLAGASTASLSIWIRVNPGSAVDDPGGVQLFGEAGGGLSVGLSASGSLRVDWASGEARPPGHPAWEQALLPGVAYHVAATRRGDAREVYLNGLLVHSEGRRGARDEPRGVDAPARAIRLGPGAAGVDVTLGEPTLWVGHALAAEEVTRLRDRVAAPGDVAPGSIALRWSLAGPGGARAAVGDPALSGGAGGPSLTTLVGSAPAYEAAEPAFALAGGLCEATVSPSGKVIFFVFRDEATRLVNVSSLSDQREVQQFTIGGVPASGRFSLGFDGHSTAPIPCVVEIPQPVHFRWNFSLPAPGEYDVAVYLPTDFINSACTAEALYEILDAGTRVGTKVLDQTNPAVLDGSFTDGTTYGRGGRPVPWIPLGRFAFATTSGSVRLSGAAPASVDGVQYGINIIDSILVRPAAGGAGFRVGPDTPPASAGGPGMFLDLPDSAIPGSARGLWFNHSAGTSLSYALSEGIAASAQAALEALPGVGPGNVAVTQTAPGTFRVAFLGAFGTRSVPLLTSTEPTISVTRLAEADSWPKVYRGGRQLRLGPPWWGQRNYDPNNPVAVADPSFFPPYCPFVAFPLFPDYERVRRDAIGTYYHSASPGWFNAQTDRGYAPAPRATTGVNPSAVATWVYEGIPPGRYRVSATWPDQARAFDSPLAPRATLSSDVVYRARNSAGAIVATGHVDQSAPPAGVSEDGATWQAVIEFDFAEPIDDLRVEEVNNSADTAVADAIRLERISPDVAERIGPGDLVTYSAKRGWAMTVRGPAAASEGGRLDNRVGRALGPPVSGPRTMPLGWNIFRDEAHSGSRIFADVASSAAWSAPGLELGARGLPTRFRVDAGLEPFATSANLDTPLIAPPRNVGGRSKGGLAYGPGEYVLTYRAASTDVTLTTYNELTIAGGEPATLADGRIRRVYRVSSEPGEYGVFLNLRLATADKAPDGSFRLDVTDLSVCPPGLDPDALPKFHPAALAITRSADSFRWLDVIRGIANDCVEFDDFQPPEDRISKVQGGRFVRAPIASIEAHPFDEEPRYDPRYGPALRVTTSAPHQMVDGMIAGFGGDAEPITLTNGNLYSLAGNGTNPVRRISDTVFTCQPDWNGGVVGNSIVSGRTGAGGVVEYGAGLATSLRDMVEFCNLAGDGRGADIFINTSMTCSDACIAAIATYCARHLKPGRKVRHEYGNEPWNFSSPVFKYCFKQNYAYRLSGDGEDFIPYYCREMGRHHAIFKAAMEAAGRGGDCIRVMGGMYGFEPRTYAQFLSCLQQGVEVDELTLGNYWHNAPSFTANYGNPENGPGQTMFIDRLDAEMHLDMWEAFSLWTYYDREVTRHRRQIDAAVDAAVAADPAVDASWVTSCRVSSYEGGPEVCVMARRDRPARRRNEWAHAIHRHPRFGSAIIPNLLRGCESDGMSAFHFYLLSGLGDFDFGITDGRFNQWMAYLNTTGQQAATGQPGENPDPEDLPNVRSQIGGAVDRWGAALVPRSAPAPRPSAAGRNGRIRAIGLPRGLLRTTR